jgi:hypothetical protein
MVDVMRCVCRRASKLDDTKLKELGIAAVAANGTVANTDAPNIRIAQ